VPQPNHPDVNRVDQVGRGGAGSTAAGAVFAEAVAIAMEAQAEAAAEAVLDTAMSVAVAAETAATAATEARRARTFAAAEAARLIADEAATAAADMRSRATAQAGRVAEAAEEAKGLVRAAGTDEQTCDAAARMAATVKVAADAALSDTALAAARVARAVEDAAANVAEMVAAFEVTLEQETAAVAETLRNVTVETAFQAAQRTSGVARSGLPTDLWRILAAADAASPVDAVDAVATELGLAFGAEEVSFLIADTSGRALIRLAHVSPLELSGTFRRDHEESATTMALDHGPAEQALRTQTVQVLTPENAMGTAGRWQVLAPVTERGDVMGLLDMTLAEEPRPETVRAIAQVAHLLSYVVIANRRHTDLFEWGQRSRPFTLSAEIQQRLLPLSRTCEAKSFTLSAWVEPASTIGGDTFDYALARDWLHFSLTDAMGHGVAAALTATVCMASLRGSRRAGATLVEEVQAANTALCNHADLAGGDDFAVGLVGRVDLTTGALEIVNAGHDVPFLMRSGRATALSVPPCLPLGMFPDSPYTSTRVALVPGDRIVLVTDGMLEQVAAQADLSVTLEATQGLHPREAVRAIADQALEAAGRPLIDDATILCLDWHGHHGYDGRSSVAGADPDRASGRLL
jgi:serine phosphatase RsbU (regulator of sigma subunit)